jgi:hypothetical protein
MAMYIDDRWGVIVHAQFLRIALDMPDGPGALKGLSFSRVLMIHLGENVGNQDLWALGRSYSMNLCSPWLSGHCTGKKALVSVCALSSFVEV